MKKNATTNVIKNFFLKLVSYYTNFTNIFTDGFKSDTHVSYTITVDDLNSIYYFLSHFFFIFSAELFAIKPSIDVALKIKKKKAV